MYSSDSYQRRQPDREGRRIRLDSMAKVMGIGNALRSTYRADEELRRGPFDDLIARLR